MRSDIFSFYKEEKIGETNNYVSLYAQSHGKTKPEALKELLDETVSVIRHVQDILSGTERWAWDEFVAGYTQFHLHTPRYLLNEILPEFFSTV